MTSKEILVNMNINKMVLCKYSDLTSSDLLEADKENPFNIYMILKSKKIVFDPENSFIKENGEIEISSKIFSRGNLQRNTQKLKVNKLIKNGIIESEYPHKMVMIKESNNQLIWGGPISAMLREIRSSSRDVMDGLKDSDGFDFLDLELLYIGQSKGRKQKSTALKRLINHSTYQKILALEQENDPDSEIWIGLCNFEVVVPLLIYKENKKSKISPKQMPPNLATNGFRNEAINVTEAALIKFFLPKYNSEFTDSFPSEHHSSYNCFYKYKIHSVMVEFFPYESISSRVSTEERKNYSIGVISYQFTGKSPKIGPLTIPSHNK